MVIVDEGGNIVNRNPSKEELKELQNEPCIDRRNKPRKKGPYNPTNMCDKIRHVGFSWIRCGNELKPGYAYREYDKDGKETGKWLCNKCHEKYAHNSSHNIMKSLRNCRTRNQDKNSLQVKADKSQELACKLYGWIDLNKENDNYTTGTPVDCYDPKTGLYHQIQIRYYNYIIKQWSFSGFEDEWEKTFESMVCFCISKDGNIVERIYKFPDKVIKDKKGVAIVKYNSIGQLYMYGWYNKYGVKNEDELKKANEIWKKILEEKNRI